MNYYFEQYASVLKLNGIDLNIPQNIQIFQNLKNDHKLWIKDFEDNVNLTYGEIKKLLNWDGNFKTTIERQNLDKLLVIKEKQIIESVNRLLIKVDDYYKDIAAQSGLEINVDNFIEVVEIDYSYVDLSPGDFMVHFKTFTRRGLLKK